MLQNRRIFSSMAIAALALTAVLASGTAALAITQDEIITLTKLGIAPDEIIKAIEKDKTVFNLAVAEILALKKAAVDEKVIKFMLATPQRFGQAGGTGPTGPATGQPGAVTPEPEPAVETEEERRAREEQLRQEALRLLEEKRQAEEAQRQAFAKGVLAKGRALADEGKFVESIQAFEQFMQQGGYPPDSDEAYLAKFGIANALVKAGLYQAAARQLVDVLLAGADKPFFKTAFEQLRELRKKVNYSPPDLEELTRSFVGEFSQSFQDEFNYVLGEFYYDYNNWTKALTYLDQVSPAAKDYAKARYLKGLVEVRNQLYKSAVQSFQDAILATEENGSDSEIADLAYMALARVAYTNNDFDAAIYYYRKVPRGSYKEATALYESAWVYFVKGDSTRSLGTFQTLHSPYFDHWFHPELWILEATVYMNICRFDYAEEALAQYQTEVSPLGIPLKQFLLKTTRPEDYYRALVETVAGKEVWGLPKPLTAEVLADVEFYNMYRTIKQIEKELAIVRPRLPALGEYGADMYQKLEALRSARIREAGVKIQRVLKETEATLADYELKVKEIEVDLQDEKLNEEERKLRALGGGEETVETKEVAKGGESAIVGSSSWQWPFEGEYWRDEIGSYRGFVSDACARE
ncbi:MAG: tetratricopeptide repeat protein [Deltaproteobacteria bacterium]|nr:tetratricopeptide repeat protein [Deltaproteobacteria bacterium]MCB9785856.1 tetratricopeptide repeat protein [Deltaproteobacteria bacterium]